MIVILTIKFYTQPSRGSNQSRAMGILLILTGFSQSKPHALQVTINLSLAMLSADCGTPSIWMLKRMGTPTGILNLPVSS
jgi:hypothetical protein